MSDIPSEKKTLLLVDGSSYLYRAFHAMPDLRGPEGQRFSITNLKSQISTLSMSRVEPRKTATAGTRKM